MAAPGSVVIQFMANTATAARNVLGFSSDLEKVESNARAADRELGALESEFDRVGDQARAAGDQIDALDLTGSANEFDLLADEAEDTADRLRLAADDMVRHVDGAATGIDTSAGNMRRDMSNTGAEIGGEFMENIAEGIGSGQVSVEDAMSGTLGGVANMVAAFSGPFAVAAGVAATGLGVMFSYIKNESNKAKERLGGIIDAVEELGEVSSEEARKLIFKKWLEPFKDAQPELSKVRALLERAGVEQGEWYDAITGSADAQETVREKLQRAGALIIENQQATGELTDEQADYLDQFGGILRSLGDQNRALGDAEDYFSDIDWFAGKSRDKTKSGAGYASTWADELGGVKTKAREADQALDDAAQPRTSTITVSYASNDSGWRPSQGPKSVQQGATTRLVMEQPSVPPPPSVIVTEEQIYRAVSRLLLRGDARNGRHVVVG